MSVKKPVVPAAAEAPAAEAKPARKTAKADYRLTHKVGVQSCKIYVKPEEEAAYYVVNKVGGKLPL